MAILQQAGPTNNVEDQSTLPIELLIAALYRWGVVLSLAIIMAGGGLVLVTDQSGYPQSRLEDIDSILQYRVNPNFPNSVSDVVSGLSLLKPFAVISLGLLLLIALPVIRVAVSVVAFARRRDWVYFIITAFVLTMLLLSFAIGEAGG